MHGALAGAPRPMSEPNLSTVGALRKALEQFSDDAHVGIIADGCLHGLGRIVWENCGEPTVCLLAWGERTASELNALRAKEQA